MRLGVSVTLEILLPPILCLLLGYALGAIPFGLLLTRAAGLGDVRKIGSGNIGATNVLRTGRKGLAAATLLLDAGKGAGAVLLAGLIWPDQPQFPALAGIGAFLGHLYPVWLRFKGGKGVATLAGIVAALHWPTILVAGIVWLLVVRLTRYSSLGSILAPLSGPVAAACFGRFDLAILFVGFALLVLWTHRTNIGRLIGGTEPKLGKEAA
ncbi:MAG: acyl phosphate:glycerol-3-phosphate acyltransferase [Sphingomonadales bacterium]|jgi:glycerol-3-phosphate acyltransferase PlsY|nr:acyl phosphate:glycerol-3-phosphate acyltransferase [Sphingomonadales bacterium]